MKVVRATHLGMCFGVRNAITLALRQPRPLTIFGDLVHNPTVLTQLQAQGVQIKHQAADILTPTVMITAHGATQRSIRSLRERGLTVLEATCPLVRSAHRALQALVEAGCHPVVIGKPDHVEVRGLTGDLAAFDIIQSEGDVVRLQEQPRFGVVAQTTQPSDKVERLVALLRQRFPRADVRFTDTVCQPTKQRQRAAADLARRCDVVIVIGGAHSNNTRELVVACERACARVCHIQDAQDLRSIWFDGTETVGITAGTSTPDPVIDEVERWLVDFAEFQSRLSAKIHSACLVSTP